MRLIVFGRSRRRSLVCIVGAGFRGRRRLFYRGRGIIHQRLAGLPAGHVGQGQGGQHEDDGRHRGGLAQERAGAGAAEEGLAGAASEGGAHVGAFAGLQQNDHNQGDADDDMQNNDENRHNIQVRF